VLRSNYGSILLSFIDDHGTDNGRTTDGLTDDRLALASIAYVALNPLESTGNYSAISINMKLVHWPLMGGLLHVVQRGGDCMGGLGPNPVSSSLYQM